MKEKEAISEKELNELLKLDKIKSKLLSQAVHKMLQIDKINGVYAKSEKTGSVEFIDSVLSQLKVKYECPKEDLKNVPKEGPFLVIGNHPYGGIDGLILMSLLLKQRPDFKMMVNYMLQQFPEIAGSTISIDPFVKQSKSGMNIKGVKKCLALLKEGTPVGLFPAGEVSAFSLNKMRIADKLWHPVVGKMIDKANVRVVPVYFSGHNSFIFNLLGLINPQLRTAKLPSELFNKNQKIQVRIGKPVSLQTLKSFEDNDQLLRFLRAKTYSLGSSLDVKPFFLQTPKKVKSQEEIIAETNLELIQKEILSLKASNALLADYNEFSVLIANASEIPHTLREITRLREITFREVGEGTGKKLDTDEFDIHYKHLFVWDHTLQKIVGAYRIGEGAALFARFKKKGFYLNNLFKFDKGFNPVFKSSLELGRSFIVKEYQRSPYPLMLLWKGINEFINLNKGYKYLIGPVSISNNFTKLSKDILVNYILNNHFDPELARCVTPRKKFKYASKGEGKKLKDAGITDIKFIDQLISDIEPSHARVPVLVKKYLSQNAKIIAFNVDPEFNNSLDGLLVLKLDEVPEKTFKMVE